VLKAAPNTTICTAIRAVVERSQPLLHARVMALPWRQVPAGSITREAGHGRTETRTVKAAHVSGLDFPWACQAIKISRWRKNTATGKTSRETAYAITSLTSAHATTPDLARLVREHCTVRPAEGTCLIGLSRSIRIRGRSHFAVGTCSPATTPCSKRPAPPLPCRAGVRPAWRPPPDPESNGAWS
jgi:hypothetical protein